MEDKNQAKKKIDRLFQRPENRENLELLYKFLTQPSKGLCLCQVQPEERIKILSFFDGTPVRDRVHLLDMANPPMGPRKLQQTVIDVYDNLKPQKDIFFIYNIEGCIPLLETTAENFFQEMNLIRDFFMQFDAEFVFFVTETLQKIIIQNAFDFYDWMKFTFTFVPEDRGLIFQPGEKEEIEYSNPREKIEYLKNLIKKVKNDKARSVHLLELGKLYVQVDDYDSALESFYRSLDIEEKYEDQNNMAIRCNEIGLCHKAKGDIEKALEFFNKALKIFQKSDDISGVKQVRANMDALNRLKESSKNVALNSKDAGDVLSHTFNWDDLLVRIRHKAVIPVIGQGLCRVEIESEREKGVLLYDYLARQVGDACGYLPAPGESQPFAKACHAFLKNPNNNRFHLSKFLKETMNGVRPVPDNSLWKLARIGAFNLFITTAYDDFLEKTLKTVRNIPTEEHYYSFAERSLSIMNSKLFSDIENSRCTLVYHIFGDINKTNLPTYTESDILETLLGFHKDIAVSWENKLFQQLRAKSLLFIGGGFDDWLYRFFIRIISNKSIKLAERPISKIFLADDFREYKKDPFQDLTRFLKDYGIEVFHAGSSSEFVDLLFEKYANAYPEEIIQPADFSSVAFISFEGRDRPAARRLADNLRKDGISVWIDEMRIAPGDTIDKDITRAIERCPVFIPLISRNSRQMLTRDEKVKYHIREWESAYSKNISGSDKTIIPVRIDDSDWMYDKFKKFYHFNIPEGRREGDYPKLREILKQYLTALRQD